MTSAAASPQPGQRPQPGRRRARAGVVAGLLGAGEITVSCVRPELAVVMAVVDASAGLIIATVVAILIVRGSDRTWERTFRLLRWAANRAEPPGPASR